MDSKGNIEKCKSVKLSDEDLDYAALLEQSPEIIARLVEIIFAGNQDRLPPS